jgi:hypothetical protein
MDESASGTVPLHARATTTRRVRILAAALSIALTSAPSFARESHHPIDAVWRSQELRLTYRAYTTVYTCKGLVSRVIEVLRAVGAREDLRVETRCDDFSRFQLLNIRLATPIEATAENVRLVTTFDPTQRLLAEIRDESLPSPADVERFAATRKAIRLTKARHTGLTAGDCALIRSISEQLFPKLEVRVLKDSMQCDSATLIQPNFTVEALVRDQPAAPATSPST